MKQVLALAFVALLPTGLAVAATEAGSTTSTDGPKVADLEWIAGDWIGGSDTTLIEEHWSQPAGSNMMGMFRLVADGELEFYEFMSIEQEVSGPVLRIKHYDSQLVGWEDREESIVFRLRQSEPGIAVFETTKDDQIERLIFERTDDELTITLEKPAKELRSEFRYRLRNP